MKESMRLHWVDNAKGVGILLVVLGHTFGIPTWLHHIIYSFHMPLFFLLSGYTFKADAVQQKIRQSGLRCYLRKQAQAYLLPYLILAGLNFCGNILYELYCGSFTFAQQLRYILGTLYCYANMSWMPMCSPIWFLVSIFLVKCLYAALILEKKPQLRHILAILCALVSYGCYAFNVPRLPWNLLPSLFGLFFFHVGVELARHDAVSRLRSHRSWFFIAIPLVLLSLPIAADNLVGMNENTYSNPLIFLFTALLYSLVLMTLCPNRRTILTWFGQNTVIFMGFNYLMRAYMVELYYLIPLVRNYRIHWTVYFGMILFSLTAIAYIYQKLQKR